jgi:signal transduction histidine kinase
MNDEPFGPSDLDLLATLASQTGAALRNARLVTDLRRLNRELAEANEDFSTLDRVKTDFITIASHELRTPLAQIRGYADIIETFNDADMLEPAQMTGLIGNLRRATERMEFLISDMLDVSKLDVDAMDLISRDHSGERDSGWRRAATDAMRSPHADLLRARLRGLPFIEPTCSASTGLRNVIVNAVKYTPDGGLIEVEAAEEANTGGRMVHVMVRDSGVGIDPAHHELIFEKFFRAADPSLHSTGSTKFLGAGPGLGLTITRGMIEGHGGRIWVESAGYDPVNFPGSTFHIVLPVHPPADARHVQPFDETRRSIRPEERAKLVR